MFVVDSELQSRQSQLQPHLQQQQSQHAINSFNVEGKLPSLQLASAMKRRFEAQTSNQLPLNQIVSGSLSQLNTSPKKRKSKDPFPRTQLQARLLRHQGIADSIQEQGGGIFAPSQQQLHQSPNLNRISSLLNLNSPSHSNPRFAALVSCLGPLPPQSPSTKGIRENRIGNQINYSRFVVNDGKKSAISNNNNNNNNGPNNLSNNIYTLRKIGSDSQMLNKPDIETRKSPQQQQQQQQQQQYLQSSNSHSVFTTIGNYFIEPLSPKTVLLPLKTSSKHQTEQLFQSVSPVRISSSFLSQESLEMKSPQYFNSVKQQLKSQQQNLVQSQRKSTAELNQSTSSTLHQSSVIPSPMKLKSPYQKISPPFKRNSSNSNKTPNLSFNATNLSISGDETTKKPPAISANHKLIESFLFESNSNSIQQYHSPTSQQQERQQLQQCHSLLTIETPQRNQREVSLKMLRSAKFEGHNDSTNNEEAQHLKQSDNLFNQTSTNRTSFLLKLQKKLTEIPAQYPRKQTISVNENQIRSVLLNSSIGGTHGKKDQRFTALTTAASTQQSGTNGISIPIGSYWTSEIQQENQIQIEQMSESIMRRFTKREFKKYLIELESIRFEQQFFAEFIQKLLAMSYREEEEQSESVEYMHQMKYFKEQLKMIGIKPQNMNYIIHEIELCIKECSIQIISSNKYSKISGGLSSNNNLESEQSDKLISSMKKTLSEYLRWTLFDHFGGNESDLKCLAQDLFEAVLTDSVCGKLLSVFGITTMQSVFKVLSYVFQRESIDAAILVDIAKKSKDYFTTTGLHLSYADFFYFKFKIMQVFIRREIPTRILFAVLEKFEVLRFVVLDKPAALHSTTLEQCTNSFRKVLAAKYTQKGTPSISMIEILVKAILERSSGLFPLKMIPHALAHFFESSKDSIKAFQTCLLESLGVLSKEDMHILIDMQLGIETLLIGAGHEKAFSERISEQNINIDQLLELLLFYFEENSIFKEFSQLVDPINLRIFSLNLLSYLFDIVESGQAYRMFMLDIKAQVKMFGCNEEALHEFLVHTHAVLKQNFNHHSFNLFFERACIRLKALIIYA